MSAQLQKHGWNMVKFGDFAQNISVRVDPADAKTDVYVGLEHLDPSTIHLRKWGHPSDVTGQKLAFKKGDVIFGRRRAYQRKLALAEFDGICSAHAIVVRAKPKMILPELLPFFLQSDMFMERAIKISVGSLSPTINWKTLQVQEFPLPPIDEQKRIAEILWAADEAMEAYVECLIRCRTTKDVIAAHFYSLKSETPTRTINGNTYEVRRSVLSDECVLIKDGTHLPPKRTDHGPFLLSVTNIIDGQLRLTDGDTRVPESFYKQMHKNWILQPSDVLLAIVGTIGKVAQVPHSFPKFTLQRSVAVFRGKEDQLLNSYLRYYLETKIGQVQIWKRVNQTAQPGVYLKELSNIPIPMVPIEAQKAFCAEMDAISESEAQLNKHFAIAFNSRMTLVNELTCRQSGPAHV